MSKNNKAVKPNKEEKMTKKQAAKKLQSMLKTTWTYNQKLASMYHESKDPAFQKVVGKAHAANKQALEEMMIRLDRLTGRTIEVLKVDDGWTIIAKMPNKKQELVEFRHAMVWDRDKQDLVTKVAKVIKLNRFTAEELSKSNNWKESK